MKDNLGFTQTETTITFDKDFLLNGDPNRVKDALMELVGDHVAGYMTDKFFAAGLRKWYSFPGSMDELLENYE